MTKKNASEPAQGPTSEAEENGQLPLAQMVAQELRREIFEGALSPGAPVRQAAVAERLGVSRLPVREALRLLETEGLVVQRPNSGARVAILDFDECLEIYRIRERLEPLAFAESVGRLDADQLATVSSTFERLGELQRDPAAWLTCDREFHLACYAGVRTPRLIQMIQGFWNTTQQYRRILLQTFDAMDFEVVDAEHRLMVDALYSENARAGEEIMRSAMERSRLRLARHRELFDR